MGWIALATAMTLAGANAPVDTEPSGPQGPVETQSTAVPLPVSEPPVIDIIQMEVERYRRMTVPVTIMDEGPFDFMVDTGAQATVLSLALADRLNLTEREPAMLVGMASIRPVETAMVERFTLGDRSMTIRTAPLVQGQHIGDADGILGLDSLQGQRVLLDFSEGKMSVSDSLGNGGSGGYDIVVRARARLGQLIIHRAQIDGVDVDVIVDTGAQGSVGNMALERRLQRRRELQDAVMTDVNGVEISGASRVARRLALGRATLNNVVISFADSPTFEALGLNRRPALILGMSELRLFKRVAIDFRSRRVLFDLPGDVPMDQAWHFNRRASRLNDND